MTIRTFWSKQTPPTDVKDFSIDSASFCLLERRRYTTPQRDKRHSVSPLIPDLISLNCFLVVNDERLRLQDAETSDCTGSWIRPQSVPPAATKARNRNRDASLAHLRLPRSFAFSFASAGRTGCQSRNRAVSRIRSTPSRWQKTDSAVTSRPQTSAETSAAFK